MKKLLSLALCAAVAVSALAGCGSSAAAPPRRAPPPRGAAMPR